MAAYPTLGWVREGTTVTREAGLVPVRATNGLLKVRRLFTADKLAWQIEHRLTAAQRSTLESFYTANQLLTIDVTAPDTGVTSQARFAAAPQFERHGGAWIATVRLLEV